MYRYGRKSELDEEATLEKMYGLPPSRKHEPMLSQKRTVQRGLGNIPSHIDGRSGSYQELTAFRQDKYYRENPVRVFNEDLAQQIPQSIHRDRMQQEYQGFEQDL